MSQLAQSQTVEEWVAQHPDADPKSLFEILLEQNTRIREQYRADSEVALDDSFNFVPKTMAQLQRMARMYCESGLVPRHYEGNLPGTAIAIQLALRCKVPILTFLQWSYPVRGKICVESKLAVAMLIASGLIDGRPRYQFAGEGKAKACTCFAIDKQSGEEFHQTVTWQMVEDEGWHKPKDSQPSKWMTLPDLMFQYRSAMFLIRVHYPDVLMGMTSLEEAQDIGELVNVPVTETGNGTPPAESIDDLSARLGAKPAKKKKPELSRASEGPKAKKSQADQKQPSAPAEAIAEPAPNQGSSPAEETRNEPVITGENKTVHKTDTKSENPPQPQAQQQPAATAKKQWSMESALSYMRARYEDRLQDFNVAEIAKRAIGQPNPTIYIDQILTKSNPNYVNFLARGAGDGQDDVNQDPGDDASQVSPEEQPECVTNPMPRPKMSPAAEAVEAKVIKLSLASSVRRVDVGKEKLSTDETAYLLDLQERRAWQLEHEIEPTDTLPAKA